MWSLTGFVSASDVFAMLNLCPWNVNCLDKPLSVKYHLSTKRLVFTDFFSFAYRCEHCSVLMEDS